MQTEQAATRPASASEVFITFLRLVLTSFGGPVAHLGYFHQALVARRRWLDEHHYADLVALCQFLPGPASSQVGIAIGLTKAGWQGAVAAWFGFTLPSAILMTIFGLGVTRFRTTIPAGLLHGLMLVAVPVVARELDRAIEMRGTLPGLTPTRHVGRMVPATRQGWPLWLNSPPKR